MDDQLQKELKLAYRSQEALGLVNPPSVLKSHLDIIKTELKQSSVPSSPHAQLLIKEKNQTNHKELLESVIIGTNDEVDIKVSSDFVSGRHCKLKKDGDLWVVEDLNSKNGVYVNGKRFQTRPLCDGDIIQICDVTLIFFSS